MTAATRVGWCPGALRPMQSGDGLLVRVKPHGGVLSFQQAEGLARLAEGCGNGQIDLTGRANLQIRGVSDRTLLALQDGLDQLGLLDADPEVEAVRNIVASPLAGLDPDAAMDIRPFVAVLERHLATDPIFRLLPPKWSIVVDDGGSLSLDDVSADVRLVFDTDGSVFIGLDAVWSIVALENVFDALSRLAGRVIAWRLARMRDLTQATEKQAFLSAAGIARTDERPRSRPPVSPGSLLGVNDDARIAGVAPPFGSLRADILSRLAQAARRAGASDLRLTPWRVLLVTIPLRAAQQEHDDSRSPQPNASEIVRRGSPSPLAGQGGWRGTRETDEGWQGGDRQRIENERVSFVRATSHPALRANFSCKARRESDVMTSAVAGRTVSSGVRDRCVRLAEALSSLGMITEPDDFRLQIVACTGAPGCHRATVTTRVDAARLAREIGAGTTVHVSGCSKGCARPASTPWTLVGRDGRYDLVRNGTASDRPLAQGLSFNEAAASVRGAMLVGAH